MTGVILHYFQDRITPEDVKLCNHRAGHCEGQQTWECLALLVAARIWEAAFQNRRVTLKVRGDNIGMLMLLVKMRPSNKQQALIARELALVTSRAAFPPAVYHTPGVAHKVADLLSQVFDPNGGGRVIHKALSKARRTAVPVRDNGWYRALLER